MKPDVARFEDTRGWLHKAALDLRGAALDLGADPPLLEFVLFHSQQAVEKTLKAVLAFHDRPFRKTHSLEELGGDCIKLYPALKALMREAAPLTEYAWLYRYPGDAPEPTLAESRDAFRLAVTIHSTILNILPKRTHPQTKTPPGDGIGETPAIYRVQSTKKGKKRNKGRRGKKGPRVTPPLHRPRQGWEEVFKVTAKAGEEPGKYEAPPATRFDREEWVW